MIFPIVKLFVASLEDLPKNKGDPFDYLKQVLQDDEVRKKEEELMVWSELEAIIEQNEKEEKNEKFHN